MISARVASRRSFSPGVRRQNAEVAAGLEREAGAGDDRAGLEAVVVRALADEQAAAGQGVLDLGRGPGGIDQADEHEVGHRRGAIAGRSGPGQAGRRPGISQSRSVTRTDSAAISSMVRWRYSSSSSEARAATSAAVVDGPGLLAPAEPGDHLGRGDRVADPQAGDGVDLGHRPHDDQVVAVDDRGDERSARPRRAGTGGRPRRRR